MTDAIGATLRDGYAAAVRMPDDIRRALARLDAVPDVRRVTARD